MQAKSSKRKKKRGQQSDGAAAELARDRFGFVLNDANEAYRPAASYLPEDFESLKYGYFD